MSTILSIDLGSANLAFAVLTYKDSSFTLAEPPTYLKLIQPKIGDRLASIKLRLLDILDKYPKIEAIIFEDSVFRGANAPALNYVAGLFYLIASERNIYIESIKPTQVKKIITGDGKADKIELAKKAASLLPVSDSVFQNDHCSDAVAIGMSYFLK